MESPVNFALLQEYVDQRLISRQTHPLGGLQIFNYSPKAQYERAWDEITLSCRGLIVDQQGNIVARPFRKFFNLEELTSEQMPAEPFEVYEKMDGSLGILYWIDGNPAIATRGSFQSPQAQFATNLLYTNYLFTFDKLDRSVTYLFEILYPENRIVVDYGDLSDLVLLAMVDTATGRDLPLVDIGFPVVKRYDGLKDISALKSLERTNAEGFVIKFQSGFRCKVKFADYVRLHRILTGISNLAIHEYLSKDLPFDELLTMVPDEFYAWVKSTIADLQGKYREIEQQCLSAYQEHPTRKESALYFQSQPYPSVLFKMLDKGEYSHIIWKLVRPKYAKAFSVDEN